MYPIATFQKKYYSNRNVLQLDFTLFSTSKHYFYQNKAENFQLAVETINIRSILRVDLKSDSDVRGENKK